MAEVRIPMIFILALGAMVAFSEGLHAMTLGGDLEVDARVQLQAPHAVSWDHHLSLHLEKRTGTVALRAEGEISAKGGSEEVDADLSEVALTVDWGDWRWQAGRQVIEWGSGVQSNPTSLINPLRLADGQPVRVPVDALAATYYHSREWVITGVWLPHFQPSVSSIPGQPSIPVHRPDPVLENTEGALRATWRGMGADLSATLFRGWEDRPVLEMGPGGPEGVYRRRSTVGLDWISSIRDVGVWAEGAYTIFHDTDDHVWEVVIGADYTVMNGLYLAGEARHRREDHLGGGRGYLNHAVFRMEKDFGMIHRWMVTALLDIESGGYRVMPAVEYSLGDATFLEASLRYMDAGTGPTTLPDVDDQVRAGLKTYF